MEIRSLAGAARFTTADGSAIRSLLDLSNARARNQSRAEAARCDAPPYRHEDTFFA